MCATSHMMRSLLRLVFVSWRHDTVPHASDCTVHTKHDIWHTHFYGTKYCWYSNSCLIKEKTSIYSKRCFCKTCTILFKYPNSEILWGLRTLPGEQQRPPGLLFGGQQSLHLGASTFTFFASPPPLSLLSTLSFSYILTFLFAFSLSLVLFVLSLFHLLLHIQLHSHFLFLIKRLTWKLLSRSLKYHPL